MCGQKSEIDMTTQDSTINTRGNPNTSRSGAEVARRAHNPKVEGSIPSSATKSPIPGGQDIVIEWFDSTMVPINYREVPIDKELKVSRRGA